MTTATDSKILPGERLSDEHQQKVLEEFHRDGVAFVRNVLTPDEINAIREVTDRHLDADREKSTVQSINGAQVFRYTQSTDRLFCDMLVREPFVSLAEAILGPDCGFVGQNVIRSGQGTAISMWHVDDILEFPLPPEIPRHDARMKMPVFWFSFQIVLSDIDSIENGPTEVVLGSHYSGRDVPRGKDREDSSVMIFEGRKPVPMLGKAGDVYLFNHQTWHRGSPNQSTRVRYLMQNQYCKEWAFRRFSNPENNCNLSDEQLSGASDRLLRMLRRK